MVTCSPTRLRHPTSGTGRTPPGKRFIQIDGPSNEESYLATVFRFAEGQELGDDMSLSASITNGASLQQPFIDMLRHYPLKG